MYNTGVIRIYRLLEREPCSFVSPFIASQASSYFQRSLEKPIMVIRFLVKSH